MGKIAIWPEAKAWPVPVFDQFDDDQQFDLQKSSSEICYTLLPMYTDLELDQKLENLCRGNSVRCGAICSVPLVMLLRVCLDKQWSASNRIQSACSLGVSGMLIQQPATCKCCGRKQLSGRAVRMSRCSVVIYAA